MNCQRAPTTFSLISYKTSNSYAICAMWCVMRDVWCVMCVVPGLFFCKILTPCFESRGDQKYPMWEVSGHLSEIPKLTRGGSHIYTLSCKASYEVSPVDNILACFRIDSDVDPVWICCAYNTSVQSWVKWMDFFPAPIFNPKEISNLRGPPYRESCHRWAYSLGVGEVWWMVNQWSVNSYFSRE